SLEVSVNLAAEQQTTGRRQRGARRQWNRLNILAPNDLVCSRVHSRKHAHDREGEQAQDVVASVENPWIGSNTVPRRKLTRSLKVEVPSVLAVRHRPADPTLR